MLQGNNATKHDRHVNFDRANFQNAVDAVCGVLTDGSINDYTGLRANTSVRYNKLRRDLWGRVYGQVSELPGVDPQFLVEMTKYFRASGGSKSKLWMLSPHKKFQMLQGSIDVGNGKEAGP